MAEAKILVCDVCGKPAVRTWRIDDRLVDLCEDHSPAVLDLWRKGRSARGRRIATEQPGTEPPRQRGIVVEPMGPEPPPPRRRRPPI